MTDYRHIRQPWHLELDRVCRDHDQREYHRIATMKTEVQLLEHFRELPPLHNAHEWTTRDYYRDTFNRYYLLHNPLRLNGDQSCASKGKPKDLDK